MKQAVEAAETFVRDLYPAAFLQDLRLEEIERTEDGRVWSITLGWRDPNAVPLSSLLNVGPPNAPRVYKTLRVDAASGDVQSMKIRSAA